MSKAPDEVNATEGMVELEAAVDQAVAACDGNHRAAVRALLVTLEAMESELDVLRGDVARIEAAVSGGYVRRNLRRREPGKS